ncbi:unnamed protein product, partial [Ectocarpus sp. 4 AP-2014]
TYLDRETASLFFHDEVVATRDELVRKVQRLWRRRVWQKQKIGRNSTQSDKSTPCYKPIRPTTEGFSFCPPGELNERMMLCTAWAYLRRGGLLVREVS